MRWLGYIALAMWATAHEDTLAPAQYTDGWPQVTQNIFFFAIILFVITMFDAIIRSMREESSEKEKAKVRL